MLQHHHRMMMMNQQNYGSSQLMRPSGPNMNPMRMGGHGGPMGPSGGPAGMGGASAGSQGNPGQKNIRILFQF